MKEKEQYVAPVAIVSDIKTTVAFLGWESGGTEIDEGGDNGGDETQKTF